MGESTTISLRKTTKKDLIKIKGSFESTDNKIYSFDRVVTRLINMYKAVMKDREP